MSINGLSTPNYFKKHSVAAKIEEFFDNSKSEMFLQSFGKHPTPSKDASDHGTIEETSIKSFQNTDDALKLIKNLANKLKEQENWKSASGSFSVTGHFDGKTFELMPVDWIRSPGNTWHMLGLRGVVKKDDLQLDFVFLNENREDVEECSHIRANYIGDPKVEKGKLKGSWEGVYQCWENPATFRLRLEETGINPEGISSLVGEFHFTAKVRPLKPKIHPDGDGMIKIDINIDGQEADKVLAELLQNPELAHLLAQGLEITALEQEEKPEETNSEDEENELP